VTLRDKVVPMPPRMCEIARVMLERPATLVSRGHIYERAWGRPLEAATRTVDTHMSRLRRLLELDGRHGWRLTSVYKHGYRLEPVSASHDP
jgi:DNA-binding response OmpR family regulator